MIRPARSRHLRRSVTAAGVYLSVGFGFLGTLFAARQLGPEAFGLLSVVVVATGFFQSLLDLTAEEALVKYGFDYTAAEDWGRLRRLFRAALGAKAVGGVLAGVALVVLAPFADAIFGGEGLETPFLIAALLPVAQSPEGVSSAALILRSRYDVRAWFLTVSMGLRMVGLAVGAHYGVTEAVIGVVAAQVVATAALAAGGLLAFRRFPRGAPVTLGAHRRRILAFVAQSSLATGIISLRTAVAPLLLGIVTKPVQVGYFRIAQAPMQGFATLSAPARMILLAEQTRDWSRGRFEAVFAGIRRYTIAAALVMVVVVPPVYVFMPELIRLLYGADYAGATAAARLILLAGALQLVTGWSKSFPVTIGRPGLRVLAHGIETAVLIPLVIALGAIWDATGAAAAVLVSTVVFCAVWGVLLVRIRRAGGPSAVAPQPHQAVTR